eukprot:474228_1
MGNGVACAPPSDDENAEEEKKEEVQQEEKRNIQTQIKTDFKIICAIDFGTDGVGLAYSIPIQKHTNEEKEEQKEEQINDKIKQSKEQEDKPYYCALSNEFEENTNEKQYPKIDVYEHIWSEEQNYSKKKAFILLNENNKLFMFGKQAVNTYECMEDRTGFKLFERFKMNLYPDPRWKKDISIYNHSLSDNSNNITEQDDEKHSSRKHSYSKQRVNLRKQIQDRENKYYSTQDVFIETLKYFKKQAIKYIKSNAKKILNNNEITCDDIQWILTIPAIWSDKAKYDMKQWAIKAGLINKNISNQLRMALEPECAALDVQYLIFTKQFNKLRILCTPSYIKDDEKYNENNNDNISLKSNDKYILIDAGGGTVDIVSHQV